MGTGDAMRLGVVILPEHPWPAAREVWCRAEALGFDHAWTYDHLAWRSLRDAPWFSAVPTLSAVATVTERIRLGPLVASPNFRHPVPFARELVALDDLSGGRFTLGLGAGGVGWDATILGQAPWSPRERTERFAEFVALLDRLLREPATSYEGRFYSANEARSIPGCVQRPRIPFALAGSGPRGLRLAAAHAATWVTTGDPTMEGLLAPRNGALVVREQMGRLDAACRAIGRDPASIARLVLTGLHLEAGLESNEAFEDTLGRYREVGVTDLVVHWPRPDAPFAGSRATFERIVSSRKTGLAAPC